MSLLRAGPAVAVVSDDDSHRARLVGVNLEGERWNHLLAAVLFFPPVSASAGVVPDGVEDVVASHHRCRLGP